MRRALPFVRSFVSGPSRPDTHPQAPKRRAWEALTQTHFTHVDGSHPEKVTLPRCGIRGPMQGAHPSGAPFWLLGGPMALPVPALSRGDSVLRTARRARAIMVLNDHIRVMNDDMYPPGICP